MAGVKRRYSSSSDADVSAGRSLKIKFMKNTYRFIKSIGFILLILVFPFIISGQGIYNNGGKIVIGSGASVYVNSSTGNFRNETNIGDGAVILSGTLLIGGNLTNNVSSSDVFTNPASGSEVIFNGSAAQTMGGSGTAPFHFDKLTLNNSKGVTIGGNVLVNNILNFQSGIITTGTNTLSLASDATVTGAGTGNYAYGNLLWNIPAGIVSKTFAIGDNVNYTPVAVAFNNVTGAGSGGCDLFPTGTQSMKYIQNPPGFYNGSQLFFQLTHLEIQP